MASGKQGLLVVVWEWENKQRRWRPYPPEVTQQLERAFAKNLRCVLLGDFDPSLKNYCIHLPQMEQACITTGDRIKVRRNFFPQSSPAGQGAVWQWAGDVPGDWHTYDMCVQCIIEESWGTGAQKLDMSKTFPACPYVINFCNLSQVNSKTGFVRAIRRVQQAAYPVGKPPQQPSQPSHFSIQGSSSQSMYSSKGPGAASIPASSCCVERERPRHRGSKEDPECSPVETKQRALFSKMMSRGNKGTTNSSSSSPGTSDHSPGRHVGHWMAKGEGSPPKPLPRSTIPPVPRPRTLPPPRPPHHPHSPPHTSPEHSTNQHLMEESDSTAYLPHSTRSELSSGRYGSNHTLDSDCSSLVSGRRPSVDTISTYLSQDDDPNHSVQCSGVTEAGYMCNPVVDKLICVESDENMDEDVFAEDQEVCDVMRGVVGRSSPHAVSPLTPAPSHHHHHHHTPSRSQTSALQQCHFMPINAAQPGSDLGLQMNGVKRKRTRERTAPGLSQLPSPESCSRGDVSPWEPLHHSINRHFTDRSHKGQQGSRGPIAPEDKLLLQYTSVVESPPDDMCSICMRNLTDVSGYLEEEETSRFSQPSGVQNDGVVHLNLCKHQFHLACVREMAKSFPQFLECPNCKTLHGEKLGNQPPGHMNVTTLRRSLPGHPDCGTLQITYSISSGIQGAEHPHPGRPYRAVGFPRIAYVPNNDKGKKVVRLLHEAWRRRLIFTVGPSVTSGMDNCVTWNEIHHKTEWSNLAGHGYPDPGYLDNTLKELALHGITEATLV